MMNRRFYSVLFWLLTPLALLRLLWRSRSEPLYRADMAHRLGYVARSDDQRPVWVHAVSAGETNAVAPLIERLLARSIPVYVTTTTATGRARVRSLFSGRVTHAYAPYDLPGAVRRFFDRVRPALLVIVDTELWPNILAEARSRQVDSLMVNARMSDRSARRYARLGALTQEMLSNVSVVACQSPRQGDRFTALGLAAEKLLVAGSIKFDVAHPADLEDRVRQLRKLTGGRRVVLGASTHAGEESAMIDAFVHLNQPESLLVLAPRHPNRNGEVEALCRKRGVQVRRRSQGIDCSADTQVLLVDTMGELIYFYALAEVAFVGGSLSEVGGHNPMEPASLGTPFVMGPCLFNIEEIAQQFVDAGAMKVIESSQELTVVLKELFTSSDVRERMIKSADQVMERNRGALDRIESMVLDRLTSN